MTVSNFSMMSKGAADTKATGDNQVHDFTYVMADESVKNFNAFFDEHETWITHRDNGQSLNVDAEMVQQLMTGSPKHIA